jgi:hypothetical protein
MSQKNTNNKNKLPSYKILSMDLEERAVTNLNKANNGELIFGKIVNDMEEKEVDRRIKMVEKALKEWKAFKKEIDNLKPDIEEDYDDTGVASKPRFSKALWKKRNETVSKMDKIVDALTLAEDKNDFKGLDELYGKSK